ncbi:MAG: cytochrome c3 family protein [Deltaproteobacteria bacterium]|nr:cytochrome c3 family protein [Deltaproteobacteria bacterium]
MADAGEREGRARLLRVLAIGAGVLVLVGLLGVLLLRDRTPERRPPAYVVPAPPPPVIGSGEAPDPHALTPGDATDPLCLGCHADSRTGSLKEATVRATCEGCHLPDPAKPNAQHEHPLDVRVMPQMTAKLETPPPLGPGRMLTCTSCHDPHETRRPYLRGGGATEACSVCHPGH